MSLMTACRARMTLYKKAVLMMVAATFTVALASFAVANFVLMPGLRAYEQHTLQQKIETLSATVDETIGELDRTASDYAAWNRTYNFIAHPDAEYARTELNDQSFEKYDIQLVMIIGLDDKLVLQKTFTIAGEEMIGKEDIETIRQLTHDFIATVRDEVGVSGVVAGRSEAYLVSVRPILTSEGLGPVQGMLVMARRIDENEMRLIRRIVHAPVVVERRESAEASQTDKSATKLSLKDGRGWFTRRANDAVAYLELLDIEGRPAAVLSLTADRDVYHRSRRVVWIAAMITAGIAVVLGTLKLWFLHALILSRMKRASKAVYLIRANTDLSIRLPVTRRDELGQLAEALNSMLEELERSHNDMLASHAAVKFQALHDALTGLENRRAIVAKLEVEMARGKRERTKVAVLLIDIDHFKQINDRFGHGEGDAVLQSVAAALDSELRPYDTAGRYGGEEFLIVVPGVNHVRAMEVAERLRAKVESTVTAANSKPVTISVGVAVSDGMASVEDVIALADAAMYEAKAAGRNRVEMAAPDAASRCEVALRHTGA